MRLGEAIVVVAVVVGSAISVDTLYYEMEIDYVSASS